MTEKAVIRQWGNSQGLRLSKRMLQQAGLAIDDSVNVEIVDGGILLKKSFQHKTFEERLSDYHGTITTFHMDWGEDRGREIIE